MTYARRVLSANEKMDVTGKQKNKCFICTKDLLPNDDIEFDHIKSLEQCEREGIGETEANHITNFAAVHKRENRIKYTENLNDIRDKFRIESNFNEDFSKILKEKKEKPEVTIDYDKMNVTFNGIELKLYKCPNSGIYFFFHTIPTKYIKKDEEVQPRLIYEDKLIILAKHLKNNFQLSASACRFKDGEILLFDGQHKAAAQYLGNENKEIECKILIDPPKIMLDRVIEHAHGPSRQMAFKSSELGKKIMHQFDNHIQRWKELNPGKQPSEDNIFREQLKFGRGKSNKAIIQMYAEVLKAHDECEIEKYISKTKDKDFPLTDNMFNNMVKQFLVCEPLTIPIEDVENLREEELSNFIVILNFIIEYSLKNKWNPNQSSSADHKWANNLYREAPLEVWTKMVAEALRHLLYKKTNDGICYGPKFNDQERMKCKNVIKRAFESSVWSNPAIEPEFKQRDNKHLERKLEEYGLSWTNLMEAQ